MQKSIGAFIGSMIVAIIVIIAVFYHVARNRNVTGSGDAAQIISTAIRALVAADPGGRIPSFNDQNTLDDYRRAGSLYEKSAMGLKTGADAFATLVANPNVVVSSAASAGVRIFTEISTMDHEAVTRLGLLAGGLAPRDENLTWFYDMERRRVDIWNEVGRDVTKPLADAAVLDPQAMTPKLRLNRRQLDQVRLAFANAAADLGGTETTPARLVDDFHWRLFGVGLFPEKPHDAASVRDAVRQAETGH